MATSVVEHADSDQRDIELAKKIVAQAVALRPGRGKAISSEDLAARSPVKATTIRDLVPKVIEEYRVPIGSCPDGYYRITEHDDFASEANRFESQRQTARRRLSTLAQAYYGEEEVFGHQ